MMPTQSRWFRHLFHIATGVGLLAATIVMLAETARADDQTPVLVPVPIPIPTPMMISVPTQTLNLRSGLGTGHEQIPPAVPPPTQAVDAAPVERLFDDWGGVQPWLQSRGINLQFNALTEFGANVTGGTQRASSFASQIGLSNDINWERLAGITGLSTHVIIVNRSGSNVSHAFGDNLLPVQEIYGSGGNVAFHLVSAFARETMDDGRFDVALGRMNVENDFASSPLYAAL
jgi:hypothetical protein